MRISDWSSDVCSSDLNWSIHTRPEPWQRSARTPTASAMSWQSRGYSWRRPFEDQLRVTPAQPDESKSGKVSRNWSSASVTICWAERWLIAQRSEEHTSELQSLMRISYAVFCLKKKK